MASPGHRLRMVRESLQLTLRGVENISAKIAMTHEQPDFEVPFIRLFRIESKPAIPNIYELYSLSVIYRINFKELLEWYGVNLDSIPGDLKFSDVPVTHRIENDLSSVTVGSLSARGANISREMTAPLENTGVMPFDLLAGAGTTEFIYAYMGEEDDTMYPLIRPGSFLQIDESRSKIETFGWRSEHERPAYFVETRQDGYRVGWCSISGRNLIVESHPLSSTRTKSYCHPQDAEILGQVVGVSMRLLGYQKVEEQFGRGRGKAPSPVLMSIRKNAAVSGRRLE